MMPLPGRRAPTGTAPTESTAPRGIPFEIAVLAAMGAVLRIYQYSWNRSLHLDETALALNLRELSFIEMLGPLRYGQFGPVGFLTIQNALAATLGESEFVLRLPALLAGLVGLVLFVLLARRVLPGHAAWLAVGLFAVSRHLVYWSADAKPYSIDVLGALVIAWLALDWIEGPDSRRALRLGVAGAVLCWFSTTTPFVLVGTALAASLLRQARALIPAAVIWLAGLPSVLHSLLVVPAGDRAYFRADWGDGFLPLPWEGGALAMYRDQILNSVYDPLGFGFPLGGYPALVALAAGCVWVFRNRSREAFLLTMPALVVVLASFAELYPLRQLWPYNGRVVLFLVPAAFLVLAGGIAWIRRPGIAVLAGALLIVAQVLPVGALLPFTRGEPRRAFAFVAEHARPGDVVYVYHGDLPALRYYRPAISGRIVEGICAQDDWPRYIEDIERLRGARRAWVVAANDFFGERKSFLHHMRLNAILLDSARTRGSGAWLFDFSGREHVAVPSSSLIAAYPPVPGTACRGPFEAAR